MTELVLLLRGGHEHAVVLTVPHAVDLIDNWRDGSTRGITVKSNQLQGRVLHVRSDDVVGILQ